MSHSKQHKYLEPRPESLYRQLFVRGTRIRAEILYSLTIPSAEDGEVYTPKEVAEAYGLPLEAVLEAIDYCRRNPPEIPLDHARQDRLIEASGMNHPDYKYNPKKHYKVLSPQEWAHLAADEPLPG